MNLPEKTTLGQHIEYGFTYLGDRIMEAKDHELEYIKLGLLSDEEKLRFLKQDLYQAARARANPEHIANLRNAISTISQQVEEERRYRDSLPQTIYGILNSIILTGILAVFFSFPATWSCNLTKNNSQACQVSRIIPGKVFQFFNDPK